MADILSIPVARDVPHQTQTTTLDGRRYRITLNWNQRIERWFLDLETDAGESVLRCKAVVLGADLLRLVRWNPEAPPGALILVDFSNSGTEATLSTFGQGVRLLYFTEG
jgi:hypothetical protein